MQWETRNLDEFNQKCTLNFVCFEFIFLSCIIFHLTQLFPSTDWLPACCLPVCLLFFAVLLYSLRQAKHNHTGHSSLFLSFTIKKCLWSCLNIVCGWLYLTQPARQWWKIDMKTIIFCLIYCLIKLFIVYIIILGAQAQEEEALAAWLRKIGRYARTLSSYFQQKLFESVYIFIVFFYFCHVGVFLSLPEKLYYFNLLRLYITNHRITLLVSTLTGQAEVL